MKVSKAQASEHHGRILNVADRLFRQRGFDGAGVSELMSEAGLTNGAFYGHFDSKSALAAAVCERVVAGSADPWASLTAPEPQAHLPAFMDAYLSAAHVAHPGSGCLFAGLGGDVARQPPEVRQAFTRSLVDRIDLLVGAVTGRTRRARRDRALRALSSMVGAVVLARAVNDEVLSAEILAAVRGSIL